MDELAQVARSLLPIFCRLLGGLAFLPLGQNGTQSVTKFSLAIILSFVFFDFVPNVTSLSVSELVFEIFLGLVVSLPIAISYWAMTAFGALVDAWRGESVGSFYDYSRDEETSYLATYIATYSGAALLMAGLFGVLLNDFSYSLDTFKPGQIQASQLMPIGRATLLKLPQVLELALQMCLPTGLIFCLVEFCFSFLGRVGVRLQLDRELFTLKAALSLLLLSLISNQGLVESARRISSIYLLPTVAANVRG